MVVASELTESEWRSRLHQTLFDTGWATAMEPGELAEFIDELVEFDLGAAARLPVGAIVGRIAYNRPDGSTSDRLLLRAVGDPGSSK